MSTPTFFGIIYFRFSESINKRRITQLCSSVNAKLVW